MANLDEAVHQLMALSQMAIAQHEALNADLERSNQRLSATLQLLDSVLAIQPIRNFSKGASL